MLPSNAAQESGGNLASLVSGQGAGGTGIAQPAGGSGLAGWLSGIYKAVTGTLSVADSSVVAAINAAAITPGAGLIGGPTTNRSTTVTAGGSAQTIAGGTPPNGYEICNPSATEDAWASDLTTAAPNTAGSYRIAMNGGCYSPPAGSKPSAAISIIAATTGHPLTIRSW